MTGSITKVTSASVEDCPICRESLSPSSTKTPCGHIFDSACVNQWIMSEVENGSREVSCPVCRKIIHSSKNGVEQFSSNEAIQVIAFPIFFDLGNISGYSGRRIAHISQNCLIIPRRKRDT